MQFVHNFLLSIKEGKIRLLLLLETTADFYFKLHDFCLNLCTMQAKNLCVCLQGKNDASRIMELLGTGHCA